MVYALNDFTWCEYTSDWRAGHFAKKVRRNVVAVSALGFTADAGVGENAMPQGLKPRSVHLIDDHDVTDGRTPTYSKFVLPVATNDADVYSVSGTPPVLTYDGIACTIMGFTGERLSLPRAG